MIGHDEESLETEATAPEEGEERPAFKWRRGHTVFAVICGIVIAALVASLISIPYYAITPGTAQSVERLIGVPSSRNHEHKGQVLLVDVEAHPPTRHRVALVRPRLECGHRRLRRAARY